MKSLTQILALSLLLSLVWVVPASAEAEEGPAPEALPTAVVAAGETPAQVTGTGDSAPDEAPARPDPAFLAGSSAGGAGGVETGLLKGQSSGPPPSYIMYEDHDCCPSGATGCACHYWPGQFCNPLPSGCSARQQPNC
jgi:hypothetical protein